MKLSEEGWNEAIKVAGASVRKKPTTEASGAQFFPPSLDDEEDIEQNVTEQDMLLMAKPV